MTKRDSADVKCPKCAHAYSTLIYNSVNVSLDPTLKERVVSGEIFQFKCPKCGNVAHSQYDCLYHDMSKALMLNLLAPDGVEEKIEAVTTALSSLPNLEVYTLRYVHSVHDLWEKIFIFDARLSDGIVELLKVILPGQDESFKGAQLRFQALDDDGALAFAVIRPNADVEFTAVPRDYYDAVRTKAFPDLEAMTKRGGKWLRIDLRYIHQYMTNRKPG